MNWQKVIDDLRETANDASKSAEALHSRFVTTGPLENDPINIGRGKLIERHRINANFCYALAQALEAGIE